MRLTHLFISAALFAIGGLSHAQTAAQPETTVWIAPAPGQQPLTLDRVDIGIDVEGFIARTEIEISFHNPNARVLEGEFVFPLAAGQTIAGYALEIAGQTNLREGVVVPKETARVAFEDITRQSIDPGLAELTQGNVFRTRLYPIPANGNKRIRLTIEQVLEDAGDHYRYVMPLAFRQPAASFNVRASAPLSANRPIDLTAPSSSSLAFESSGNRWQAKLARRSFQPQRELAFRIPKASNSVTGLEATDVLDPRWRTVVAQIDTGSAKQSSQATKPRRIAIYFDASGSAAGRDVGRERKVLGTYLAGLGDVEVQLIAFRDVAEPAQRFALKGGNAGPLLAAMAALPFDGGSSYGSIDLSTSSAVDRVLIIGDGLSNFGSHTPQFIDANGATPTIYALHAAQEADHAALARLAAIGGGQVIELLYMSDAQAISALSANVWRLVSVATGGAQCVDMQPSKGAAVAGSMIFTARCRGKATLELKFGAQRGSSVSRQLTIGEREPVAGAMAASANRLFARASIDALEMAARPDEVAIAQLGTRYQIVTRFTSLLVLDRIEDYLRYRIEPKEDDLRAEYLARLPAEPKPVADVGLAQRVESLSALWREFKTWHTTPHSWLETLLLPTAQAESQRWAALANGVTGDHAKRASAAAVQAERLAKQSADLARRWQREGAGEQSRTKWEREASRVMVAVDALRRERDALPAEVIAMARNRQTIGDHAMNESAERDAPASPASMAPPSPAPMIAAESAPSARRSELVAGAAANDVVRAKQSAENVGAATSAPAPATITLAGWNPDTPYLAAIRAAGEPYATYLAQRTEHGTAPAFFLDVADHFRDQLKQPALAQRILSNIAELDVENTALTRVLGYRLAQWGAYALAVGQFEEALRQRGEEPQSYRDLALALARQPNPDISRAVALLWKVASGNWHGRFPDIELIALHEINDLLAQSDQSARSATLAMGVPPELIDGLFVGLRVSMTWDADNTDIDLWVTDPAGEEVYYGKNRSTSGGHVSRDFTQGYGPEIYTIARPLPGTYKVRAHYFGDRRQSLTGPVTVQVEFETGFGAKHGQREAITRRLESGKEWVQLGEFSVGVVGD